MKKWELYLLFMATLSIAGALLRDTTNLKELTACLYVLAAIALIVTICLVTFTI
jgi:hypothetical protein